MVIAFVALLIFVALAVKPYWLVSLFAAVAAMHWTASLHLPDPIAPLYGFVVGGFVARLALELIRPWFVRLRG